MEAATETSPRSSTLSTPALESGPAATRSKERFDLVRTAKMVAFERVLRQPPAATSAGATAAAMHAAWALAASVALAGVASLAFVATYLLFFPRF